MKLTSFAKTLTVILGLGLSLQSTTSLADFGRPGLQQGGQFSPDRGGPGGFDRSGPDRGGPGGFDRGGQGGFDRGGPRPGPGRPFPQPPPQRGQIDQNRAADIVRTLYRGILFREVDPSGLQSNTWAISQGGFNAVRSSARGIVDSPEFRQNVWSRFNAGQIVNNLYNQLLGRQPDPGGFNSWVQQVEFGNIDGVVDGFVSSPEFRQRWGI